VADAYAPPPGGDVALTVVVAARLSIQTAKARIPSLFATVSVEKNRTYCTDVLPAVVVTLNGAAYAVAGEHVFDVSVQYAVTPQPVPPPSEQLNAMRTSFAVHVADAYALPPGGDVALTVVVAVCLSI
jgi:hypothetical protein